MLLKARVEFWDKEKLTKKFKYSNILNLVILLKNANVYIPWGNSWHSKEAICIIWIVKVLSNKLFDYFLGDGNNFVTLLW